MIRTHASDQQPDVWALGSGLLLLLGSRLCAVCCVLRSRLCAVLSAVAGLDSGEDFYSGKVVRKKNNPILEEQRQFMCHAANPYLFWMRSF